jgi:hypothetical protein
MVQLLFDTRFYSHKFAHYIFQIWKLFDGRTLGWCRLLKSFVPEELKLLQVLVKLRETSSSQKEADRLTSSLTFRFPQETGHPK